MGRVRPGEEKWAGRRLPGHWQELQDLQKTWSDDEAHLKVENRKRLGYYLNTEDFLQAVDDGYCSPAGLRMQAPFPKRFPVVVENFDRETSEVIVSVAVDDNETTYFRFDHRAVYELIEHYRKVGQDLKKFLHDLEVEVSCMSIIEDAIKAGEGDSPGV